MEARMQEQSEDKRHQIEIIINGQMKSVSKGELTFDEVVSLAYGGNPPTGENWFFTITYRRGQGHKPEGSLVAGESVKVKEGMIFNVRATDKS